MTIIYRILGTIVNVAAMFLAICLVLSIPLLFSSPINMLSGFMLVSIVLYAWYSLKFRRLVLQRQQVVKRSLRDWVRVNGIVTLIYSVVLIAGMAMFMQQPEALVAQMKQMGVAVPAKSLVALLRIILLFGVVVFVHVLWTFALIKKNISYFQL